MKSILACMIFLLPLHAFLVTVLKCRFGMNVDLLRFWKEWILTVLVISLFFTAYKHHGWSLKNIYKKNTLLGLTTAFIICSAIYIFFPFFQLKAAWVLGFRYDTYFLIAMISFSQNVEWHHRFQWTFGWPIRFSVFLTIVYSLFAWWVLSSTRFVKEKQYYLLWGFGALIVPSIFLSYSKTSVLGFLFSICIFVLLSYKYIYRKKITRKFYLSLAWVVTLPIALVALLKWELFLHLGSVLNRLDNLSKSIEMFFYNPFWYGLWIAGPASQLWNSIESAGNWQIATSSVFTVHKFLPENWYVQILLEQWIVWFALFMALIILIWYRLIDLVVRSKSYMNVWIATAYFSLLFMALFTHAFEEAATSYILFFVIGLVLADSISREKNAKK